jgi:hypothetical protein
VISRPQRSDQQDVENTQVLVLHNRRALIEKPHGGQKVSLFTTPGCDVAVNGQNGSESNFDEDQHGAPSRVNTEVAGGHLLRRSSRNYMTHASSMSTTVGHVGDPAFPPRRLLSYNLGSRTINPVSSNETYGRRYTARSSMNYREQRLEPETTPGRPGRQRPSFSLINRSNSLSHDNQNPADNGGVTISIPQPDRPTIN